MATQDMEVKEIVDKQRFVGLLRDFLTAAERGQDCHVVVKGEKFYIPGHAFDKGRLEVEYEIDEGEHEFELTLKWR